MSELSQFLRRELERNAEATLLATLFNLRIHNDDWQMFNTTSGNREGQKYIHPQISYKSDWQIIRTFFVLLPGAWELVWWMIPLLPGREPAKEAIFLCRESIFKKNYLPSFVGVFNRHKLGRHQHKTSKNCLIKTMHTETQIYSISVHQELCMDIKGRALWLQTRHLKHFDEHTDDMIAKIWGVIGSMTLRFECLERKKLEPICPWIGLSLNIALQRRWRIIWLLEWTKTKPRTTTHTLFDY